MSTLDIAPGEMVALIGASGSGKSTLLRHMAGLMPAITARTGWCGSTAGPSSSTAASPATSAACAPAWASCSSSSTWSIACRSSSTCWPARCTACRSGAASLRWFTAEETARGIEALRRVGIADCCFQRASTLSGGQQQRAAIARAMVQGARVILADEPIASLDPESSRRVMDILAKVNREDGCTVVVSLHQVNVAMRYCARTVALHHGRVVYDGPSSALTPQLLRELYGAEADEILSLGDHIGSLQDARSPAQPAAWTAPLAPVAQVA